MASANAERMDCTVFEESLSDYLERALEPITQKAMAGHALQCPLCHSLLNDVKEAMFACQSLAEPRLPVSRLEAKILCATLPESNISCLGFEDHLTDYLDGFLPADVFHRWERHAALCDDCTDLPGMVVRSIAAVFSYKLEQMPLPHGLHERILESTIGTDRAREMRPSFWARFNEWIRGLKIPISVPQLAPVAMMTIIALMVFSQSVSADGSLKDVYQKGYQLAEETYKQGSEALSEATGGTQPQSSNGTGEGTSYVSGKK